MAIESNFNPNPIENPFSGDPAVPHFKFTQEEKDKMLDEGMSENDITAKEVEITTKQIENSRRAA